MKTYYVENATRDRLNDKDHTIDEIGGTRDPEGRPWRMPTERVVKYIDEGLAEFLVMPQGLNPNFVVAPVRVITAGSGPAQSKFLTTQPNQLRDDNLESLPDCPQIYPIVS